ncbi:MAG TPA: hypothetical protein VML00_09055 [Bacteroidota bacterium]|nr:hypothetical protein [Bacteroidota bacterium]
MKMHNAVIGGMLALGGLFIAGCTKHDGGPVDASSTNVNQLQQIQTQALADPFVQNDQATFADQSPQPTDYGTLGKIDAPITPLRWARIISGVSRTVTTTILPGDTMAVAHIVKTITGTFKVKTIIDSVDTVIAKPFTDVATRNLLFRKVNLADTSVWWPAATSLIDGGTNPAPANNQIAITEVQVFAPTDTITITDPSTFYLRYGWRPFHDGERFDCPQFHGGDKVVVQATVVSASVDTDLVALRYGFGFNIAFGRRQHMNLISETKNTDGTYTRVYQATWYAHFFTGFFNAGVDAITRGTLYDDSLPYSASWWGVPYRVF